MAGIAESTSDSFYVVDGRTLTVRVTYHDYVDTNGHIVQKRPVKRKLIGDFTAEEFQKIIEVYRLTEVEYQKPSTPTTSEYMDLARVYARKYHLDVLATTQGYGPEVEERTGKALYEAEQALYAAIDRLVTGE